MKDANFGDLFVGQYQPQKIDHLFMSIQTFNSQEWKDKTTADFYDYIVVESYDSKKFTIKLLSVLPLWYNESSFLYVENA